MNKAASFTKRGPGRKHKEFGQKTPKQLRAGAYAEGLRNWRTNKPSKGRV